MRHRFVPLNNAIEQRTRIAWDKEKEAEEAIREQDRNFQLALLDAYERGEFPGQEFRLVP